MNAQHHASRSAASLATAAVLGLALAVPAAAQQHEAGHGAGHHDTAVPTSGLRAELIQDVEQLESKLVGLAEAMKGKYDWRPAEGVRSVGEVFLHVAGANFMLPMIAGAEAPEMYPAANMQEAMAHLQAIEKIADEAESMETLRHSFTHLKHSIASIPDDQLDAMTTLFGRDATKRQVLTLLVTHNHEHLGQSIAYARSNGVVPPWSAGT